MRPWDGILNAEEQRRYRKAGFGRSAGMGAPPGLFVIDVQYRTVGAQPKLFAVFREIGWPVLYPYVAPASESKS